MVYLRYAAIQSYLPTLRLLDGVFVFLISPKYPSAEIEISSFEHRRILFPFLGHHLIFFDNPVEWINKIATRTKRSGSLQIGTKSSILFLAIPIRDFLILLQLPSADFREPECLKCSTTSMCSSCNVGLTPALDCIFPTFRSLVSSHLMSVYSCYSYLVNHCD